LTSQGVGVTLRGYPDTREGGGYLVTGYLLPSRAILAVPISPQPF